MPPSVTIDQKWSVWSPSRRQWLLATVVGQEHGQATLRYNSGYGIAGSCNEQKVDEARMLAEPNLFRFVEL